MKFLKNPVFMFILGVVTCTITTVLASSLIANNISYTPQDKTWGVDNVGAAIDSLKLSKTSDNYSTDEKVVGTWVDGKPVYQRTFYGNQVKEFTDSADNIDELVSSNGSTLYVGDGNSHIWFSYPYVVSSAVLRPTVDNNHLVFLASGYSNLTYVTKYRWTVQYTKTTD
ncbi:MAG: hypothetical protein J6G98_01970 [Bacilli bacterium]|nr:hypothetical protein [Bacilli bacterium]